MTILRDLSVLWSLIHVLIMFALLFDSRYPRKKTILLTACTMVPLLCANFLLYLFVDTLNYVVLLGTCVLPSLIFFWIIAKHRDGRLLFTFCLSDTLWLEIMYITNILDFYLGNAYIFMFISRLILYPLLELYIVKRMRPVYRDIQKSVTKGWYIFSAISAIFYVMTVLSMSWPTMIMERTEYLPAFVLQLILMPTIYIHIFSTLRHQQELHRMTEQENILKLQVAGTAARIDEYSAANEKFRVERHDFRHKMQTIAGMVEKEQFAELRALALEYNEAIREMQVRRYSDHAVLDAVLSSYLQKAESRGIAVTTRLSFPDTLPVSETGLATVFANAIENAIHACGKLEVEKRRIAVKVLTVPCFMLQISNSFDGAVEFDKNGLPVSHEEGHGFGTRSIVAFCEKYGAFYEFKVTEDTFYLRITFS